MNQNQDLQMTFEDIVEQNERRIHYHIQQLKISDPDQEFFQEGLCAMWNAYRTYQPDKVPLATYLNYMIRYRLIDLIRLKAKEQCHHNLLIQQEATM
ncbi:sigma factor [Oceanobacillus halotolerans]|uniref:sigma factor n=1 Tax=Oceanobacillus halotolerans TaxID=2663380 RepID=UPI00299F17C3|nr:sigma factor [Oceanobacillus halotolerans]